MLYGGNTPEAMIAGDFVISTLIIEKKKSLDVVQGKFYLAEPHCLLFETSSPVHQLMKIRYDTTEIYYPEEAKLFRIVYKKGVPDENLSLTDIFNTDIEKALHDAGLRVDKFFNKGDTVFMNWSGHSPGSVTTARVNDNLVLCRTKGKNWSLDLEMRNYRNLNGKSYPEHMRSIVKTKGFEKIEELRLGDVKTGITLPDVFFENWCTIPGIVLKAVDW